MLTFALCDDEAYFLENLKKDVQDFIKEKNIDAQISAYLSGTDLLKSNLFFDIILMDVKLPGEYGIDVITKLRQRKTESQVIFITSYREYALQAFDLNAIHYLLKPVSKKKLYLALEKALKACADNDNKALVISKGSTSSCVYIRDILYCEAINHKIHIHTVEDSFDYFGTLDTLLGELDSRFFRCHKSYIVNLSFVTRKDRESATVLGGQQVLISRRRQKEFAAALLTHFRKEAL